MSLLHIGVALGLSAAAAFLVTGTAMRPIKTNAVVDCAAVSRAACLSEEEARLTGSGSLRMPPVRSDTGLP